MWQGLSSTVRIWKVNMRDARQAAERRKVDLDLLDFMQRYAHGLLRSELVSYFAARAESWMTPDEIARAINRPVERVLPHLADLAYEGMLDCKETDGVVRYALTQNPRVRDVAMRFRRRMLANPNVALLARPGEA